MAMISTSSQMRTSAPAQPGAPEVAAEGERSSLNSELWHACAGPLVLLPAVGSRVVYFPQGHSEQVAASTQKQVDAQMPAYPNLPPQIICQLHDVILHADMETDEVYCQMTLQPVIGLAKESLFTSESGSPSRQPTIFFCKTLTASDTSTHGGFSIPRRAAEKVFPPLDFAMQPPAQQLVARDLHDTEWKFRHIYRGQPKRHLLTTGWSVFVSAKRLVAGDSVLFIRNEKGQLLLGIRRATRPQTVMPSSVLSSDTMHIGVLAAAAHAANTGSRFTVFYNPRASPSEFVIPLSKFEKAVCQSRVSVGMRFRMLFETEESSVRRYMGTITDVSDLDPVRWPNSHWRSIKVGWDESTVGERQRRVSLWEIEPLTTFLVYPPATNWRLQHPLDIEFDSFKRSSTWLQFHNGNVGSTDLLAQGMGINSWLGSFQPKMNFSIESDAHNVLGATAAYPSKQIHFQTPSQIMPPDFKSQSQSHTQPQQLHVPLPHQSRSLSGPVHQEQLLQLPHQQPILQSSQLLQQQARQQQSVQLLHHQQTSQPPLEKQPCQSIVQQTSLQQLSVSQKVPQLSQPAFLQGIPEASQQTHQQLSQLASLQPSCMPSQQPSQQSNEQLCQQSNQQPCQQPHLLPCQQPSQLLQLPRQQKQPRLEQQQQPSHQQQQFQTRQKQQPAQQPPQQSKLTDQQPSLQQQNQSMLYPVNQRHLPQSDAVLQQQQPVDQKSHQHQEGLAQPPQLVYASSLQQQVMSIPPQVHSNQSQPFKKEEVKHAQQSSSQIQVSSGPPQSLFPVVSPPPGMQLPKKNVFLVQQAQQPLPALQQQQQQELLQLYTLQQSQVHLSNHDHLQHRQSASLDNVQAVVVRSGPQAQALPNNSVSTPQSISTDSNSVLSSAGNCQTLQSIFGNFAADAFSSQTCPTSSQPSMEPVSTVASSEIHHDLSAPSSWATAAASQLSSVLPASTKDLESTCVSSDAENILMPSHSILVPPFFPNSFRENFQEHYDAHSHFQGSTLFESSVDMVDPSLIEPAESRSYSCNSESQVQFPNQFNHVPISDMEIPFGSSMFSEPLEEPCLFQTLPPVRTYTKVHKSGCVGRSLDVSRFNNYDELRRELARMFGLEGLLESPSSGWQLIFVDKENDWLLLGDDPWELFVHNVRSITILSPSEVVRMQDGIGLPSVSKQTMSTFEDGPMQQEAPNFSPIITSTCSFEY